MNILNLIIKQKFFDEILAGTKTVEYREVKPTTIKKYCWFIDAEDERPIDEQTLYESIDDIKSGKYDIILKEYDAIRLYVGYNKDRDSALVECTGAKLVFIVDDDGNNITYEYKDNTYPVAEIEYYLGKVLEKDVNPKNK